MVHVWSTCHRSPAVRSGLQRSPAVHRSPRSQVPSWGNKPVGRSLIRPPWPRAATRDENRAARLSSALLVRQSPLLRGRFSFQDEAAGSSPARPTTLALSCANARRLFFSSRLFPYVACAQRSQNASLHYCALERSRLFASGGRVMVKCPPVTCP